MKRCPECRRDYYDDSLLYCLDDSAALLEGPASSDEPATALFGVPPLGGPSSESRTSDRTAILSTSEAEAEPQDSSGGLSERHSHCDPARDALRGDPGSVHQAAEPQSKRNKLLAICGIAVLILIAGFFGYRYFAPANSKQIESIAVMPFVNDSGNADLEYLSDGMTETLISSLSRLPNLNVKPRSSVFRYKGKENDLTTIGRELNVQAVLNGRVVQRGSELSLFVELIDVDLDKVVWSQHYDRKQSDIVTLQAEIARDVAQKLKNQLSGADEERLTKTYTSNPEAYQLYLKGRYNLFKLTPAGIQSGISFFQQAIDTDPNYALAYVGLASAYRANALSADMPSSEFFPKAKAAAQKAVQIDDNLAEAHAVLGFTIFWYDWDWKAAEAEFKRAIELNPNSADAHWSYGHLLSNLGHHSEALAEVKLARELDPLSLIINASEGMYLIDAGQPDEGLARLQKTLEIEPNYWFAHMHASTGYCEKGMYPQAVAEARKAMELNGASSLPVAYLGYALAKSGNEAEARKVADQLLTLSTAHYVPPYHMAVVYNGLNDREKMMTWLERGITERDPKMTFLKVDPRWAKWLADPAFREILNKVGFTE